MDVPNKLRLNDGRSLAWAECGDPRGQALFFFHGTPGSRLTAQVLDAEARKHGVRVIAPERPGHGESDSKPGRTLLDWASDVRELADSLALERFAVAGISGGGPYAAICAHALGARVTRAAILSGIGPTDVAGATRGMLAPNRFSLWTARNLPALGLAFWALLARQFRDPERAIGRMARSLPESDRAILADGAVRALFVADFRAALAHGSAGAFEDFRTFAQPWGFALDAIRVRVRLWHGERDRNCPVAMARHVAGAIPGCEATIAAEEGHLFTLKRVDEILAWLAARA
jgi:pimeloyl-ACP methyl ester carboxylesterase